MIYKLSDEELSVAWKGENVFDILKNKGWTEVNNKEGKTPHQIYREEKQSNS